MGGKITKTMSTKLTKLVKQHPNASSCMGFVTNTIPYGTDLISRNTLDHAINEIINTSSPNSQDCSYNYY